MSPFQNSLLTGFAPGYVEIFLGFCLLVLLLIGSVKGDKCLRLLSYLSLVILGIAILVIGLSEGQTEVAFHGLFVRNSFTRFCKIIVLVTTAIVLIMTIKPLERDNIGRFEYPILLLLCTLGMMIMISSNDLIAMYLGLELQSLALYILVGFKRDAPTISEGSVKYFILGALASAFILYGSSFLYGLTGTTEWDSLFVILQNNDFSQSYVLNFGFILVLSGLVFKLALVPFHMWAPDVYQSSPTPVTALIATAPKVAMFALLMRLFSEAPVNLIESSQVFVVLLIWLSLTIGSFGALFQTNIKRLLGYSAISHMSYAFMGILSRTSSGYDNILIYLIVYMITTLGIFVILLNLKKNGKFVETIHDFLNLSREHPLMAAAMTVFLFSLAGIPPLGGFFAKLGIFNTALEQGYYNLVVYAVLMSVVSAGYYLKIIKTMYFDNIPTPVVSSALEAKNSFENTLFRENYGVMLASAFILLAYSFIHRWLIDWTQEATFILFS
ncbi:MAG: NADH-quinone oxidoreductase subunit N [Janthinobacterium lividum]